MNIAVFLWVCEECKKIDRVSYWRFFLEHHVFRFQDVFGTLAGTTPVTHTVTTYPA